MTSLWEGYSVWPDIWWPIRTMRRSFVLLMVGGVAAGIILGEFVILPTTTLPIALAVGLFATAWSRTRWIGLVVLACCCGLWRWQAVTAIHTPDIHHTVGQEVTLSGTTIQPPSRGDQQVLVIGDIHIGGVARSGKIQVWTWSYPEYHVGQRVALKCRLEELSPTARWRQWSHGIHARCFQPTVMSVTTAPSSVRVWLGRSEEQLVTFIHRSFNEPQASLLAGIILGDQSGMPADLSHAFQATGTTHIVALSGFNVTIIVTSVMTTLMRVLGRRWAWVPGLLLVIVFVVMTGASASVVRAAIMAVIGQLGLFLGRPVHPSRLLSYTAIIMTVHNPFILLHDLGFQLSFLATIGLVFLSKPVAARMGFIPNVAGIRESLGTTIAAMLVTEPLLLWQFGRLSIVAPLVNMIVLPFIPLAMGVGTVSFLALLLPPLLPLLTALTDAILRLVLMVITTAASWTWSFAYLSPVTTTVAGALFVVLAVLVTHGPYDEETFPA